MQISWVGYTAFEATSEIITRLFISNSEYGMQRKKEIFDTVKNAYKGDKHLVSLILVNCPQRLLIDQ